MQLGDVGLDCRGSEVEIEILRDVYLLKEEILISIVSNNLVTATVSSQLKDNGVEGVPASSRLSPLTLEASNTLLPPLSSHLR